MVMFEYNLEVTTGNMPNAGTTEEVYITIYGVEEQSERTKLDYSEFIAAQTTMYSINSSVSLGELLMLKVEKDPLKLLPQDEWYCSKIVVKTPEENEVLFPSYRWITRDEPVELRGGKAMTLQEDNYFLTLYGRDLELAHMKTACPWEMTDEKLPHHAPFKDISEFPAELRFSMDKSSERLYTKWIIGDEMTFKGLAGSTENWARIEDIKQIFWTLTAMSMHVVEHWQDDDFFAYQFLNGPNPNGIKKCSKLPPNFPVTEEMVKPFLKDGSSLKQEIENGNIFICDQKIMDGIPTRMYHDSPLHVAAGFCLFYLNPDDKLLPIAIQLHQRPSEQNPIFLPSDPETDWLLAKLFVKSADLLAFQAIHYLLSTHYLAEVFIIATFHCLPSIHPIYKLLIPHFRFTLHINTVARNTFFGPDGTLESSSLGYEGIKELMRRGLSRMTYTSLCLPDNITARGLESMPDFFYRDDGLKLWNIINSFVKNIVNYYYHSDCDVGKDSELQDWIDAIFEHGFLGRKRSGFPAHFDTAEEVIKFITMVIFIVSAQHAAYNNGQFDYNSWVPNGSLLLCKPPPTTKGESSMQTILETLPNVGETVEFAGLTRLLSRKHMDVVLLGQYPDERFDETAPKKMIKEFQAQLTDLSYEIIARNAQLKIPYTYLNPNAIENSITI